MTSTPQTKAPAGACDSHIHIYGDPQRFAFVPYGDVRTPAHFVDEYLQVHRALGLSRAVIVQTPLYETDNACVIDNIANWCPDSATVERILVDNPAQLYDFPAPG